MALRDECCHLRASVDRYSQRVFQESGHGLECQWFVLNLFCVQRRKEQEEREALLNPGPNVSYFKFKPTRTCWL